MAAKATQWRQGGPGVRFPLSVIPPGNPGRTDSPVRRFVLYITPMIRILVILFALVAAPPAGAQVIETGRVRVEYGTLGAAYAEIAARAGDEGVRRASQLLGHEPAEPLVIVLTSTKEEFGRLTGDVLPEWSAAVALPEGRIVITPLAGQRINLESVIMHETAHLVLADAAGDRFVPRWFHEGIAELVSGTFGMTDGFYLAWHVVRGRALRFDDIQSVFSLAGADVGLAYDESLLAVQLLTRTYGPDVIRRIAAGLTENRDFADAFWAATGLWPSEYEKVFLGDLKERYGSGSVYALVPGTWTFVVLLAFIVWILVKLRTRRRLREWEAEEPAAVILPYRRPPYRRFPIRRFPSDRTRTKRPPDNLPPDEWLPDDYP